MKELLPPNATPLERALADIGTAAAVEAPIDRLWSADSCPVELLPWLAWSLSVEDWDEAWTEEQKRAVIRDSVDLHRIKGTPEAVRRALRSLGHDPVRLTEGRLIAYADGRWNGDGAVKANGGRQWAEYGIEVGLPDAGFDAATQGRIAGRAQAYGRAAAHLVGITARSDAAATRDARAGVAGVELGQRDRSRRGPLDGRYRADGSQRGDRRTHVVQQVALTQGAPAVRGPDIRADGRYRSLDAHFAWLVAGETLQVRGVPVDLTRSVTVTHVRRRSRLRPADGSALADGAIRAADAVVTEVPEDVQEPVFA